METDRIMNVSQGDRALIIFSVRPQNVGRLVHVAEYIGKFEKGEKFEFRGITCEALVHDHYWWIDAPDLEIKMGPSPRAYIADSWLRRINPPKEKISTKEELDITV